MCQKGSLVLKTNSEIWRLTIGFHSSLNTNRKQKKSLCDQKNRSLSQQRISLEYHKSMGPKIIQKHKILFSFPKSIAGSLYNCKTGIKRMRMYCLYLRNKVTAAGRFQQGYFVRLAWVQNYTQEKKQRLLARLVITKMPGNEYLKVQVGQEKSRKLNPIFSSVPSLWLQPGPQIRRVFLFTLVVSLVNIIVHQGLDVALGPDGKRRNLKLLVSPDWHVVCTCTCFRDQWLL